MLAYALSEHWRRDGSLPLYHWCERGAISFAPPPLGCITSLWKALVFQFFLCDCIATLLFSNTYFISCYVFLSLAMLPFLFFVVPAALVEWSERRSIVYFPHNCLFIAASQRFVSPDFHPRSSPLYTFLYYFVPNSVYCLVSLNLLQGNVYHLCSQLPRPLLHPALWPPVCSTRLTRTCRLLSLPPPPQHKPNPKPTPNEISRSRPNKWTYTRAFTLPFQSPLVIPL